MPGGARTVFSVREMVNVQPFMNGVLRDRVACGTLLGATVLSLAVGLALSKRFSNITDERRGAGTPRDAAFAVAWSIIYASLLLAALLGAYDARGASLTTITGMLAVAVFLTALWPPLFVQDTTAALGGSAALLAIAACLALNVATFALPAERAERCLWAAAGLLGGWLLVASTLNLSYISSGWNESLLAFPAVVGAIAAVLSGNPAIALPILFAFAMTPIDPPVAVCIGVSALALVFAIVRAIRLYRAGGNTMTS
jgi:tryptophan-rich sensory protein